MSVTYITYRLRRVDDKHWKASVEGPYNIAERTPRPEIPHFYGYWGYIATTDLDLNNSEIYVDILARAMLKYKAEEIHRIKMKLIRAEAEYKKLRKAFRDLDKVVATMTEEGVLGDDCGIFLQGHSL